MDGIGVDGANDVFLSQGAASAAFVRQVTTPVTLQVYATPLYADFPLTPVGPGPSSLAVTVTDPTGSTVTGGPTTVSGANASDFLVNDGCNGATLAPGGTCTVGLTFEPHQFSQLDRSAVLNLTNSGGPTTAQTVGLFGQAPPQPTITAVTPTSGTGTSATTVTVTGTNLQYVTSASFGTTGKTDAVTHDPIAPDTKLMIASPGTTNPSGGTVDITVNGTGGTSATSSADQYTFSPWGRLRVTTPNLPTVISIDGNVADTWGTNSVHEDAGTHTVCYSDVEGWATPACQTVTVVANTTTLVSAAFVQRGWLRVQLSPAGIDGTISVDGTRMDDYGMWTDLTTGNHQVCFSPVTDYTPPPCQSVTVTAGNTLAVTGTYTSSPGAPGQTGTGMLRVTTNPAVDSQISVDGTPRDTWALDWLQLPGGGGTHQVCFRSVAGFAPPPCSTVSITAGQTTTVNGAFTQHGYIDATVGFGGADLVISVDGIGRDDGTVWTEFPVGTHTVCFGAVQFEAAPLCQTATVTAGNTADIFGTYGS